MDEPLLITDEVADVLASLRHVKLCLKEAKHDPHAWKWVCISLFLAVQGAIVCHATGSTGIEALRREHAEIELAWLNGPELIGVPPEPDLAGPRVLWNRLTGNLSDFGPAGGTIKASASQKESFDFLKRMRDSFIHFTPKLWVQGIHQIKSALPPLIDLIEEITNLGYAFRHGDIDAFQAELTEIRSLLAA